MSIVQDLRSKRTLMSVQQVATIMDTCAATIRRYVKAGKLACIRAGSRIKFEPSVIADFIEKRSTT